MGLVDYSDSEEDEIEPDTKKRKLDVEQKDTKGALPPLPAGFRDLYSSTVRTSTQDDPSLHGGRKRVTPHVVGNWPAHVYLEWNPQPPEYKLLLETLNHVKDKIETEDPLHSLLANELGVQQPLHVSLSRPLSLKTEQKDDFLNDVKTALSASGAHSFEVAPLNLIWHPNENGQRSFLVLHLDRPKGDELRQLLDTCNDTCPHFQQPLLYQKSRDARLKTPQGLETTQQDSFHVSVAWSLKSSRGSAIPATAATPQSIPDSLQQRLQSIQVPFSEVKLRIGQDVYNIPLRERRASGSHGIA